MKRAAARWVGKVSSLLAAAAASTWAWAVPTDYKMLALGAEFGEPVGISDTGMAVGYDNRSGAFRVKTWRDGVVRDLGPGLPRAVNSRGLIVGTSSYGLAFGNVTFWDGDTTTTLPIQGIAWGVNDNDVVVGQYVTPDNATHAFKYDHGVLTDLHPDPAIASSDARAINAAGQVVVNAGGNAYLYSANGFTKIPPASDRETRGLAISESGVVSGTAFSSGVDYPVAIFEWDGTTLSVKGESDIYQTGYNGLGDLAGHGDEFVSFLRLGGEWIGSLKAFPAYLASQWCHGEFNSINDARWILATSAGCLGGSSFLMLPPSLPMFQPPPSALSKARKRDVDGDAWTDLLWRNADGSIGAWSMDGLRYTHAFVVSGADPALTQARPLASRGATAVLETNYADQAYRKTASGLQSSWPLLDAGSGWYIVGQGDFDGDGNEDVLLWSYYGGYAAWLMNADGTIAAGAKVAGPTSARPAIVADFDGDGRDDVLWQGDDGHFELWTMNGLTATPAGLVRAAGTGVVPAAIGDFNADGRTDIVWKHPDGRQSLWLMNGAGTLNSTALTEAGSPWHVAFAADLDGDGKSDLLWAHDDGSQAGWLMDGTRARAYGLLLGPGTGWRIAGTADLDGNGTADLVWRKDDGSYAGWLMNGLQATQYASFFGGGTGWELVP